MLLIIKILLYIVFLIVFGLWIYGSNKVINRLVRDQLKGNSFITTELMILLSTISLFGFVWMLTGFFNLWLIAIFLIGSNVSLLITGIIWAALGSPKVPWGARAQLGGVEFALKNMWLTNLNTILSVLVLFIGYPIAIGIIYFSNDRPSAEATTGIFQATLIVMFVFSWLILLPTVVSMLYSENMDTDTRNRILIGQIGGLGSTALYVVLLFWAFDLAGGGYTLTFSQIEVTITPVLLITLVIWFGAAFLLPHLLGTQRNRKWREHLFSRQIHWIDQIVDGLEYPDGALIAEKLGGIVEIMNEEISNFIRADKMVEFAVELDGVPSVDHVEPGLVDVYSAYKLARYLDPRFGHIDFLRDLSSEAVVVAKRLVPEENKTISQTDVNTLTLIYRNKKEDVGELMKSEQGKKPQIWIAIGFLLSPIFGQIFSEIGKLIWVTITQGTTP